MTAGAAGLRSASRAALAGVVLCVTACAEVEEASAPGHHPAVVEDTGNGGKLVRFDWRAVEQVGLRTARVSDPHGMRVVPYAALIYDPAGSVWVYSVEGRHAYQRHEVEVDRVVGDRVWLRDGPPPGTRVVTTGATQVYGAELGIEGGH